MWALEVFCSSHPFSPFPTELPSRRVLSSLLGPRLSIILLAAALCDPPTLREALLSLPAPTILGVLDTLGGSVSVNEVFPARGRHEEKAEEEEEQEVYFRLWKVLVCQLLLSLCTLKPSVCVQRTHVVSKKLY